MSRTLADKISDDVSSCFLRTDHFAATYTYTARGGATTSVTGVWIPDETPDLRMTRGEENFQSGKLMVASSVTVTRDGTFSINSQTWVVSGFGPADGGMKTIELTRQDVSSRAMGSVM